MDMGALEVMPGMAVMSFLLVRMLMIFLPLVLPPLLDPIIILAQMTVAAETTAATEVMVLA